MSKEKITVIPGGITKIETLKDNSIKIVFTSQEITNQSQLGHIMGLCNKYGYVAFSESKTIGEDVTIPDEKIEIKGDKSMSRRKRDVMWLYWKQSVNKNQFPAFDSWYKFQMEKEIDGYKELLN